MSPFNVKKINKSFKENFDTGLKRKRNSVSDYGKKKIQK